MKYYDIPPASLERLRMAYQQFEQLAGVISEAMGLGPGVTAQLDLAGGHFNVKEDDDAIPDRVNGIAQEVRA